MNGKLQFLKMLKQKDYDITLSLIKDNIVKISKTNSNSFRGNLMNDNTFINTIQNNPTKLNNKFEFIFKKIIENKNYKTKFDNFFLYIEKLLKKNKIGNLNINPKIITNSFIINDSIAYISIYIFKYLLNENKHFEIKKYIKLLISIISINIFSIQNFTYILDLFLNIILDLIYMNKNEFNSAKKFSINESPLYFINDIIEGIISYPYETSNNLELLESIIDLLNNFIFNCQSKNIILTNDIDWLKLLKNKIVNSEKLLAQTNIDKKANVFNKLISFLTERYKYQIPKNFYYEIFKECAIDLQYYLNAVKLLLDIFGKEQKMRNNNKFKIKNGFYILNNTPLTLSDVNLKTNEYSLIFSFQILKIEKFNKRESILLLNLYKKYENILKIFVDKDNKLQIIINNNEQWNTNIKIDLQEFYLLCICQKNNNKIKLYINKEGSKFKNYKKFNTPFPKFDEGMSIELGKNNFRGIIGETFIINKIFKKKNVGYLFNANEYYADLLYNGCKEVKYDIISQYNSFYLSGNESINYFQNEFKYKCLCEIMTHKMSNFILDNNFMANTIISKLNYSGNNLIIYKMIYSIEAYINEDGIDYIIFMLHNISTFISDVKLFNLYLYYSLNLLQHIVEYNPYFFPNKINDEKSENNYLLKLNELFLTLAQILNNLKANNDLFILNNDNKELLIIFLDYFIVNKFLRDTIFSILLDNRLFDFKSIDNDIQRIFIYFLNVLYQNKKTKTFELVNEEIAFKILSFDYILEIKKIKYEFYYKTIGCCLKYSKEKVFKEMIFYILSIDNDFKLYQYLKFIYINTKIFKKKLNNIPQFSEFLENKLEKIKSGHCVLCSYTQFICYLLKNDIFSNKNEIYNYSQNNDLKFMKKPSSYMIKCIFIKNFKLDNRLKLKFIKSKDNSYIEILKSQKTSFFELAGLRNFIPSFTSFIHYLLFLKKEYLITKDKELFQILEEYLFFILNIVDLILTEDQNVYTNDKIKLYNEIKENFFSCEGLINFFKLYLDFNNNNSFQKINEYIKITIDNINDPFYFVLLENETNFELLSKLDSKLVRANIIKSIINEITKRKKKILTNEITKNIIKFLTILYRNIFNGYLDLNQELSRFIVSFIYFLMNKDFYAIKHLFIVNINQNELVKKFLFEMIIDILIFLSLKQNDETEYIIIIESFLDDNEILSCSIFYNLDKNINLNLIYGENILNEIKGSQKIDNFSFSIYFFIYFIIMKTEIQNKNSLKSFQKIIDVLFKDLIKLFKDGSYKPFAKLKIDNFKGMNKTYIQLYNEIISIFTSNVSKNNFSYDFVLNKINGILPNTQKIKNNNNFITHDDINNENKNDISIDDKNSTFKIREENNNDEFFDMSIYYNRFTNFNNKRGLIFTILDNNLILNLNRRSYSLEFNNIRKIRKKFFKKNKKEEIKHINTFLSDSSLLSISMSKINYDRTNSNSIITITTTNALSTTDVNSKSFFENSLSNYSIQINNVNDEKTVNYYIKEKLSKINTPYFFYENINSYSQYYTLMKFLFNPKEYFVWKKFAIIFKNYIFNNKKFKQVSKCFDINYRKYILEKSDPNDEKYFLNYPTKIKNFITQQYIRPFLKPNLSFFNNKLIKISHSYINQNLLLEKKYKEDNFYFIEFKRIIPYPIKKDNNEIIYCEKVCNKGNIFGYMIIKKEFIIFINDPKKDMRMKGDLKTKIDFIYSFKDDIIEDKNKFTLIYFKEIKEMFLRRICFNYFAYEIFLRDNHAHLFNFFNEKILNLFLRKLNSVFFGKRQNLTNNDLKNNSSNIITNNNENNNTTDIFHLNFNDIKIVDKPLKLFEQLDYKQKFINNEISIFNYLLLLNKYSSRSYNNYNQYLIFPILICKNSDNVYVSRDLSKAMCLNKKDPELEVYENNIEELGYYFNTCYSSLVHVLYYLERLAPFTYNQIKFQSGKFDSPDRQFSSMDEFLSVFLSRGENREFVPEIFYHFEMYLNLNKNNFGSIPKCKNKVNNFNQDCKNSIIEFTIYYRRLLEKQNTISKWIDNVFGSNQYNDSINTLNAFPKYCYEQFNDLESIKNSGKPQEIIYKELNLKINYLNLGIIPSTLFGKPHPDRLEEPQNKIISSENLSKKEIILFSYIIDYIFNNSCEKYDIVSNNNNLVFLSNSNIEIFSLEKNSKRLSLSLNYKQIKIQPYRNSFTELIPGFYCFVRYEDKIIRFISEKESYKYLWRCIPTAVEKYRTEKLNEKYLSKIFIGDENGFLHLMEIEYKINSNKNIIIISILIVKSIKAHLNYIKGILFDERLNVVLTWCGDGIIRINNAYSFTCLNIITLGKKYNIKKIEISKYNLMYISCYNIKKSYYYIKCFTLNGIKVTKMKSRDKIINFFLGEKITVVFSNEPIKTYNLCNLSKEERINESNYYKKFKNNNDLYVFQSIFLMKNMSLLIIYNNNFSEIQKVEPDFW